MGKDLLIKKCGQNLWLSPLRAVFWEEARMLILSDLHVGKSMHFRKSGIAVPGQVFNADLQRLDSLLNFYNPDKLLVTGDFFHSHANDEHEQFSRWRQQHNRLRCCMVRGNHEILTDQAYTALGIEVLGTDFDWSPFHFTHVYSTTLSTQHYVFSGHLHPGIKLSGYGRQSLVFPCFYFSSTYCILPAFSRFSGKYILQPQSGDEIFAIVDQFNSSSVVAIN